MATVISTPTAGSLTVSGNTQVSGTISWSKPTIPSGGTISSCILTGTATASMSKGSATITVNGTTVTSGVSFSINLGTSNTTTSVTTTAKGGNKNAEGTVTFSNLVYTVTYTLSHTVTFVDWDGTVLSTQQVQEGESAIAPTPSRNGYEFTGWDIDFSNVTSDLTVTAQYVEIQYFTVTFVDWDGTVLKVITDVEEGMGVVGPDAPTREGYKFIGWDSEYWNITSDLTVTAQYREIVYYTVTFVDWDGTVLSTQQVQENSAAIAPSNPERENYIFTGWNVSFSNVTSNLTVTAQYKNDESIAFSGIGTVVENIDSENEWTYKLNMDWDTQYLELEVTPDYAAFMSSFILNIWSSNSTSSYYDCHMIIDDEGIFVSDYGNSEVDYSNSGIGIIIDTFIIRFSKSNKMELISNSEIIATFDDENEITGENIIYLSSLNKKGTHHEGGLYSTINRIEVKEITENKISIQFEKETDTVVSEDGDPVVYKLNYSLQSCTAEDITITITDIVSTMSLSRTVINKSTIAIYNEATDEITFIDNGEILVTATSNQDPTVSASMTLSASGIKSQNIFPKFTENEWELDNRVTIDEQSDYSITMTSDRVYSGISLSLPTNWYGKKVTLGCSSIDSTGYFYIVNGDSWNKIATLNSTTLEQTIVIPENENNLILFFESRNRGTMSVSDLYAYVGNVEDIALNSISLVESAQVKVDRTVKLTCVLEPSDANAYDILWSSDSSNISLQSNGASCIVSGISEGTAIVTATDSITGLSANCTVTVFEKDPNLFPPFTQYPWILGDSCTLVSQSDYAISLTATETFDGPILDIPESWYGKTITFSCTEMTSNAAFYISTYPAWDTVTAIDYRNKLVTVTLPSEPMKFCFQCTDERTNGGAFSTSGLYITSDEIEQDDYSINFMPPFTSSLWIISNGATVLTREDYNCSLNITTAWAGYAAKVPSSWYGKTIEIGCESLIGTGALISVQDESGDLLGQLNPTTLKRTIDIPESGDYYIYFQSLTTEQISITGLYADQIILEGNNMFPIFTDGGWVLDTRATLINAGLYDYSFTTAETVGWIGVQIAVPEEWKGKAMHLRIGTITDNASLVVEKTTNYEDLLILNSANPEGVIKILPNEQYILFFRTDLNGSGEVSVTGAYADVEYDLVNVDSISLSETNIEIQTYTDTTIECILSPADASCYNLTWELDNDNITLSPNDLTCNLLAITEGSSVLTVTDTISGKTASCNITIVDGGDVNIFPPFTTAGWYLSATATLISVENYSYSFETPTTWNGVSINVPDTWYGKTIEISYESISANGAFYVQETDSWSLIGELNPSINKIVMNIPEKGTFSNIVMALQAPSTAGTVSITGANARVIKIVDEDDNIEDETNFTCLEYENRIVGYKKPEPEEVVANAVICYTTGQVLNALASATAGQTIYLKQGIYTFPTLLEISVQGTFDNYISIKGYPGDTVIISNTMVAFLGTAKYINFENIKIMDLVNLNWSYALEVYGGASYINFRNIRISNIKCSSFDIDAGETNGCNPFVLYGNATSPISNVLIENCYIHDCDTGWSEGLTFNGNVENCIIRNCTINNITNIGIDFAGNYEWTGTVGDTTNQTRNCIIENTLVMNCQSPIATSAGLYSDGARDCTFRYNVVYNAQCGIELGGEQPGATSENFYVHNNLIIDSGRCIGVGGYQETSAGHQNAYIYNNTFVCGDNNRENYGLYVERASNVNFFNNIVYGTENTTLFSNWYNSEVNIGNNCWYQLNGEKPSVDITGIFTDPLFINNDLTVNGDYQLLETSPCFNIGTNVSNDYIGDTDLNGNQRILFDVIDIGAFESNVESSEKIKVAEYKFDSSTDTLPTFNSGFIYTYTDIDNGDGTITRTITSDSLPSSISFKDKTGLVSLSYIDISNVTSMYQMFRGCNNLTSLDVSNFNTSNVTNMSDMFYRCQSLTSLDVNNFNTSNVTDMSYMFYDCNKLTSLDLSNWNIIDTTIITDIFNYTPELSHIGMLYSNKETVEKIQAALPNVDNLQRTIWVQDTNEKDYVSNEYVIVKEYGFEKQKVRLPQPLRALGKETWYDDIQNLKEDKLYWDNEKGRYCIEQRIIKKDILPTIYVYSYSDEGNYIRFNILQNGNDFDDYHSSGNFVWIRPICNTLTGTDYAAPEASIGGVIYFYSAFLRIQISKDQLETYDEAGLQKWLTDNPTYILYKTKEPTIIETDITEKIALNTHNPYMKITTNEKEIAPTNMVARFPYKGYFGNNVTVNNLSTDLSSVHKLNLDFNRGDYLEAKIDLSNINTDIEAAFGILDNDNVASYNSLLALGIMKSNGVNTLYFQTIKNIDAETKFIEIVDNIIKFKINEKGIYINDIYTNPFDNQDLFNDLFENIKNLNICYLHKIGTISFDYIRTVQQNSDGDEIEYLSKYNHYYQTYTNYPVSIENENLCYIHDSYLTEVYGLTIQEATDPNCDPKKFIGKPFSVSNRYSTIVFKNIPADINDIIYYRANLTLNTYNVPDGTGGIYSTRFHGGYNSHHYAFKKSDIGKDITESVRRKVETDFFGGIDFHLGLHGDLPEGFSSGDDAFTFTLNDYVCYNLTKIFGSMKEPTKEWCDKNLPYLDVNEIASFNENNKIKFNISNCSVKFKSNK